MGHFQAKTEWLEVNLYYFPPQFGNKYLPQITPLLRDPSLLSGGQQ
jgi:hypothetical protein